MSAEISNAWVYAACPNCRATFYAPRENITRECPNCFSARLDAHKPPPFDAPPELVVPFSIAPNTLEYLYERWLRGMWFKPRELNVSNLVERSMQLYLPLWLVDANVNGQWQAQMGFDYLVASTQERFDGAQWTTQKLNETRVRWETRAGEIARRIQNVSVPALNDHTRWMNGIGATQWLEPPFDLARAVPIAPDTLQKTIFRAPEIPPFSAWNRARDFFPTRAARECKEAANAQHIDHFQINAEYDSQNWTLLLLPLYVSAYRADDGKIQRVFVNGQSDVVNGVKRASMRRAQNIAALLFLAAALTFLAALAVGLFATRAQELLGLAILLVLLTFALAVAACAPILYVWQFNRQANEK